MTSSSPRRIWAMTPGHAGMEQQALGLAEAIGGTVEVRRVRVLPPWTWLPGDLWPWPLRAAGGPDRLDPPWPDLIVSCGRTAAPLAAAVRRASSGQVRVVHVQNPLMRTSAFDVVVAPQHDRMTGANVVETATAPHRVTRSRLQAAEAYWSRRLAVLGRPLVAVLIGAPRGNASSPVTAELADMLGRISREQGAGLVLSPSRRTPAAVTQALAARLEGPRTMIWDGSGENPYLGMLACADAIVVTEDSVSMISEALAAGKPVYIARFGGTSRRITAFIAALDARGAVRWFDGNLASWSNPSLDDTARAAAEVRRRIGWDRQENG